MCMVRYVRLLICVCTQHESGREVLTAAANGRYSSDYNTFVARTTRRRGKDSWENSTLGKFVHSRSARRPTLVYMYIYIYTLQNRLGTFPGPKGKTKNMTSLVLLQRLLCPHRRVYVFTWKSSRLEISLTSQRY